MYNMSVLRKRWFLQNLSFLNKALKFNNTFCKQFLTITYNKSDITLNFKAKIKINISKIKSIQGD